MTTIEVVEDIDISDEDDKIRVYGSTSSENPFKSKKKINKVDESESQTDIQVQKCNLNWLKSKFRTMFLCLSY